MIRSKPYATIQRALFIRLQPVLTWPLYDSVPTGTPFPYVVLAGVTGEEDGTIDIHAINVTITLRAWDGINDTDQIQRRGVMRIAEQLDLIATALTDTELTLDDHRWTQEQPWIPVSDEIPDDTGDAWRYGQSVYQAIFSAD